MNKKYITTITIILVILVLAVAGFYVWQNANSKTANKIPQQIENDNSDNSVQVSDWAKYSQDDLMAMYNADWQNQAMYYKGLEGNYLIIDQGTAPDPRGLIIYDLSSKEEVLNERYSSPLDISANSVAFWSPTSAEPTGENCPDLSFWQGNGLGAEIESHVSFNLTTLTKSDLNETRCHAVQ